MFSSNTAEIISFQKKKKKPDLFSSILSLHKKLKEVAQYESLLQSKLKSKSKLAKLKDQQVEKLKQLETDLDCCLVAYDNEIEAGEDKAMILNRINSLLDEYLSLCYVGKVKNSVKAEDNFSKFFEQ